MKIQQFALLAIAFVFAGIPVQTSQAIQNEQSKRLISQARTISLERLEKDFKETMQLSKLITKAGITGRNLITIETATPEGWTFNASVSDNAEWVKLIFPCTHSNKLSKDQLLNLLKENCQLKNARFEEYYGMIHLVLPIENRSQSANELVDHLGLLYNQAKATQAKWNFSSGSVAKQSEAINGRPPTSSTSGDHRVPVRTAKTPQFSGKALKARFDETIGQNKLVRGFLTYRDQTRSGTIEFFEEGKTTWHAALTDEKAIPLGGMYQFENDKIFIRTSNDQLISLDLNAVFGDKLIFQNEKLLLSVEFPE